MNILGTNDPAVIGGTDTQNLTETNAVLTTGGTLTISDVDSATTFTAQTNVAGSHGYGHFSINAAGAWTYATDTAHNEFVGGATYTDTLSMSSADGTSHQLTVNILGTNEAGDPDHDIYAADGTTLLVASAEFVHGNNHNFVGDSSANVIIGNNDATVDHINTERGNDTIYGRGGDDDIQGGPGDDVIYAGSGNDTILAGTGADLVWGGSGNDTFVFAAAADSTPSSFDSIQDFQVGVDRIDVEGLDFVAGTSGLGNLAAHSLNWSQVGSDTIILGDTNGNAGTAEFKIVLKGITATSLHLSDFILT